MPLSPPPGPMYLFKLIPFFLVPAGITYALLRIVHNEFGITLPTWITIFLVSFSRLFLTVFQRYYLRYQERKGAAQSNAFVIPHVQEKRPNFAGFALVDALVNKLKVEHPVNMFSEWSDQYGNTFQLRLPTDNMVVTVDPDHVKAILATQFDVFEKGPVFRDTLSSLLGDGIFNADGEMWKFHRSITRPFFTKERISDFENFDAHAEHTLKQARERLADGYAIDFQDLVSRFTLDSATQFLFGKDIGSLDAGLPYPESASHLNTVQFLNHPSNLFANTFLTAQMKATYRNLLGAHWRLSEFWKDNIKAERDILDKVTEPLFEKALADLKAEKVNQNDGEKEKDAELTLLEYLVRQTQDKKLVMDELLNLLVAGRDTTASLLTFCFYMMSEHPDVAKRLRKEILEKVGPTEAPTYSSLRELRYLRAFINETLRMYPIVPINNRHSIKATVLTSNTPGSKPFYVPADTEVVYSVIALHRRTDLWGPDALEFDPDRFLDERLNKYLTPNPYIFCPFNAGPRICLGQQFAYQEASFFLVRLLQQFHNFGLAPESQPAGSRPPAEWANGPAWKAREKIVPTTHLTMCVKGGLWVKMDPLSG